MRFLALAPFIGMLALAAPLRAGDTTYSETRAVPRAHRGSEGGAPGYSTPSHSGQDEDNGVKIAFGDDEEAARDAESGNPRDRFLRSCMSPGEFESVGAVGAYILTLPFRLGFCYVLNNFGLSHVDLVTGTADMQALPDRPWRLGFGFGLGALDAPGAAFGIPFSLHAEAVRTLSDARQLRLRAATFGSLTGPLADYERTILVDGAPAGVQRDHISAYSLSGYPLTVEGLWSNARGLYFAAGGGALVLREEIDALRTEDAGADWAPLSEVRHAVRPLVSLGVGRWASRNGGRRFQRFEIRYQAALLLPDRRSSFPGDNAMAVHSLAWDWSWLW